jgi:hypothetical protein
MDEIKERRGGAQGNVELKRLNKGVGTNGRMRNS